MKEWKHPTIKGLVFREDVKFFRNGRHLTGTRTRLGYWQIGLDGKSLLAHRLMFECVLGRSLESFEVVNHKNTNRFDNSIDNLELTNMKGNIGHYHREFVDYSGSNFDASTVDLSQPTRNSKLSKDEVKEMILGFFEGLSNNQVGKKYGVHPRYVSLIRHKKRWKRAWVSLGLEGSTTIPSGSRATSDGLLETEPSLHLRDMI